MLARLALRSHLTILRVVLSTLTGPDIVQRLMVYFHIRKTGFVTSPPRLPLMFESTINRNGIKDVAHSLMAICLRLIEPLSKLAWCAVVA